MYVPDHFREDRLDVLHGFIRQWGFATMISHGTDGMIASHLPVVLDASRGERGTLLTHLARPNPQWRHFADDAPPEAMFIFHGPHAYVSPTWYATTPAVPTWNYAAVHAYGTPRLITDRPALRDILDRTIAASERFGWSLDAQPAVYVETMMKGIVGIEVPIARIEGKLKLSQNRSAADRAGVIAALGRSDFGERAVAEMMSRPATDRDDE